MIRLPRPVVLAASLVSASLPHALWAQTTPSGAVSVPAAERAAPDPAPAQAAAPAAPEAPRVVPPGEQLLTLRDLQQLARQRDPRTLPLVGQADNARAKLQETRWAWFPTFETQLGVGGPVGQARINPPVAANCPPGVSGTCYLSPFDAGSIRTGLEDWNVRSEGRVDAILPLWTWNKITNGISAAEAGVKAREALLQRARDTAAFDVARAYWGWQTAFGGLNLIEGARDRIRDARKVAQKLLDEESDQVSASDVGRLDYAAEEIEAEYAGTVKSEALALIGLKLLVGVQPEEDLPVGREQLPPIPGQPSTEEMIAMALERRPELIAARENVKARLKLVEVERGRFFPDFGLVGQASYAWQSNADTTGNPYLVNPGSRYGYLVGLGLRGTFDFPQKFARLRAAEADLREAQGLMAGAEALLKLEVNQALQDLREARTKHGRYQREAKVAKELSTKSALAFDAGLGDARELVIDTTLYARAEGSRIAQLYAATMAWAALERAVGAQLVPPPSEPPLKSAPASARPEAP